MKLVNIGFVLGGALIFVPPVFDLAVNRWVYYLMCLIGAALCAIAGYSAQAAAVGMGEPGEEILRRGMRWFKLRVLHLDVREPVSPEPSVTGRSCAPRPPRSLLSRTVLTLGVVLALLPTTLGWDVSPAARIMLIGIGSVLVVISTRNLPPRQPDDPPHGQEFLQAAWHWLRNRW